MISRHQAFAAAEQGRVRRRGPALPADRPAREAGMSRIDCMVIQLMLVAVFAASLYLYERMLEPPDEVAGLELTEGGLAPAGETGMLFGFSGIEIMLALLALVGVIFVVRLVVDNAPVDKSGTFQTQGASVGQGPFSERIVVPGAIVKLSR